MTALKLASGLLLGAMSILAFRSATAAEDPKAPSPPPQVPAYGSQPGQAAGMIVESYASADAGKLVSNRIVDGGAGIVPHGLTVAWRNGAVYRSEIYDAGRLVSVTDYWPGSGLPVRTIVADTRGDGRVELWSADAPGRSLAAGVLRAGKPWGGRFLEVRLRPNTFGQTDLAWVEYADGREQLARPATFADLGVPAEPLAAHERDPKSAPAAWQPFFEQFGLGRWDQPLRDIAGKADR